MKKEPLVNPICKICGRPIYGAAISIRTKRKETNHYHYECMIGGKKNAAGSD